MLVVTEKVGVNFQKRLNQLMDIRAAERIFQLVILRQILKLIMRKNRKIKNQIHQNQ